MASVAPSPGPPWLYICIPWVSASPSRELDQHLLAHPWARVLRAPKGGQRGMVKIVNLLPRQEAAGLSPVVPGQGLGALGINSSAG